MDLLHKYLTKISKEVVFANSTYSTYYYIDNFKIRVSEHYSPDSDAMLQIIKSYDNNTKFYALFILGSTKMLLANLSRIKAGMPYWMSMFELSSKSLILAETTSTTPQKEVIPTAPIPEYTPRFKSFMTDTVDKKWCQEDINKMANILRAEFNDGKGLTGGVMTFLKNNAISGDKILQAMNYVHMNYSEIKEEYVLAALRKVIGKLSALSYFY